MTADRTSENVTISADAIGVALVRHLEERLKTPVTTDHDLFASGLVSSMFAMELVVHLEKTYGVTIVGTDLKLDNFRTVGAMAGLVLRLRGVSGPDGDV
jgi:methoxymalonate biosynthesis acyl carrier protein